MKTKELTVDGAFEGTPHEIAEQLFKKVIGPVFDHMAKDDQHTAVTFGYCMAGLGISCYLNSLADVDHAEKVLIESIKSMAKDIKNYRNKVC